MVRLDRVKLVSELNRLRTMSAQEDEAESPSVIRLRGMLTDLSDLEDRYFVHHSLVAELRIQGDFAGALEAARNRLAEFGDIVSRIVVARSLLQLGQNSTAVKEFKKAFYSAIEVSELVNYTFGELMRAAASIGDLETINSISAEYLALKPRRPKGDCRLEVDWMDAAETLGARPELIAELRRRAGE